MEFIQNIKSVLSAPGPFFESKREDDSILKPWLYYLIVIIIYYVIAGIAAIPRGLIGVAMSDGEMPGIAVPFMIGATIVWYILAIVMAAGMIFVSAAILHLFLMIVGAKNGYIQTFKIACYGSTPFIFLGPFAFIMLVPYVGIFIFFGFIFIISIYAMIIQLMGAKALHEISTGRAVIGVIVLPMILGIIIFLVLMALFMAIGYYAMQSNITGFVTGFI